MTEIPAPLLEFLLEQAIEKCSMAYLHVDAHDHVIDWGGELEPYGIEEPADGTPVIDVFVAAHDTAGIGTDRSHIPRIATDTGKFVDMHVIPDGDERWILLIDASAEAQQQSLKQQKANSLRLLENRLAKQVRVVSSTPEETSIQEAVLSALGATVLYRASDGRFHLRRSPPDWLVATWPDAIDRNGFLPQERSPFLENFLIDAEDCWGQTKPEVRWSGVWREPGPADQEQSFEAIALNDNGQKILVLLRTGAHHREKIEWQQRARENTLVHRRLVKEIEKKDVLLHCIIHDLRGPMVSTRSCLELLSREELSEKGESFLEVGLAELKRQDLLIRTILDAFKADVLTFEPSERDQAKADVVEGATDVLDAVAPICAIRNVTTSLDVSTKSPTGVMVTGERLRLNRVIGNLVDNALRHTKSGSNIRIAIDEIDNHIRVAVEDEGPGVPPEIAHRLFDRFFQVGKSRGNIGLALHFCRITIEGWGGAVGHENRTEGGSRFWFSLPKPATHDQ